MYNTDKVCIHSHDTYVHGILCTLHIYLIWYAVHFTLRCGSGLSGEALSEAGHCWVGVDISQHMLSKHIQLACTVRSTP